MIDVVAFIIHLIGWIFAANDAPWRKNSTARYCADLQQDERERQKVIDDMMARYERDRHGVTIEPEEPEILSLSTDAGTSRWPTRQERIDRINKYRKGD